MARFKRRTVYQLLRIRGSSEAAASTAHDVTKELCSAPSVYKLLGSRIPLPL